MIGTAAGVIVGATFVVAALAAGMKDRMRGADVFLTPSAIHLGSTLIGSAVLVAPTLGEVSLSFILSAGGVVGVIYTLRVAASVRRMELGFADRMFHAILPVVAYGAIALAPPISLLRGVHAFRVLAAALVLLLVIGMRNAWTAAMRLVA